MTKAGEARTKTWLTVGGLVLLVAPLLYVAIYVTMDGPYWNFVRFNYLVFFGMPYAALFAYFLVGTLESIKGPIEVDLPGFKFKGAAGPLVFWILIFLSVVLSLKMLWRYPDQTAAGSKEHPASSATPATPGSGVNKHAGNGQGL